MNRRFIRHLQLSLGTLDLFCVALVCILLEMMSIGRETNPSCVQELNKIDSSLQELITTGNQINSPLQELNKIDSFLQAKIIGGKAIDSSELKNLIAKVKTIDSSLQALTPKGKAIDSSLQGLVAEGKEINSSLQELSISYSQFLDKRTANYNQFFFFLMIAWLAVVFFNNTYGKGHIMYFEKFARRSAYACLYFSVVIFAYLVFWDRSRLISSGFVVCYLFCFWAGILFNRFLYLGIRRYFRSRDYLSSKVLIVGYNPLAVKLAEYLEGDGINKEIVGFSEEPANVRELSRFPILSTVGETIQTCKEHGVTEIYSTIIPEKYPGIYNLILEAEQNCIRFRLIPDIGMFVKKKVHIDYLHEIPIVSLRNEPLEDLGNRIRKRIFDIVVSFLVVALILSWLVPLIAILIKLESKGPVFFKQLRSGKGNKPFLCLKFRSMRVNGKSHELQATRGDERITRIGKFLRRTSLDEFPQFLNVLKGEMSIVGPRPHMLKHTDQYSQLIGQYMVRQFLKPGISGWAQIHGYRGETQEVEQMQMRVDYDIWYMENWSLWLDIRIIFSTIFNAIKGEENAF